MSGGDRRISSINITLDFAVWNLLLTPPKTNGWNLKNHPFQ